MPRLLPAIAFLATTLPLVAQVPPHGLEVRPDPQNIVASALLGSWKLDRTQPPRFDGVGLGDQIAFRDDAGTAAKIPEPHSSKLRGQRIFLAGVMELHGREQLFVLTEAGGNPTVVWFRDGTAESFPVMLARAATRQDDQLFVGAEPGKRSLAAYTRTAREVGKLSAPAALADMLALLAAGKTLEFAESYFAPEEISKMAANGMALEQLVAQFKGARLQTLIAALQEASKAPPSMNDAGDEALWTVKPAPGKVRLQRIEGRWYLRNR